MIDDRSRYILDLLAERGPLSDDALSTEVIGDQGSAEQIAPFTEKLKADGLIAESGFAPRRWSITENGQVVRRS